MKKRQGFAGQRTIELNGELIASFCAQNPSSKSGFFTKVGFYPDARYQFIEDEKGREEYILIYCINGYGMSRIEQTTYHISPGDFFIIPAKSPFSYHADELKPWSIFWFFFKGDTIEGIADIFIRSNKTHKGFLPYNEERVKLFNKIYQYLERGYGQENIAFMNMCLLNLVSSLVLVTADKDKTPDKTQSVINSTVLFMKEQVNKNLSLSDLAANVHMSVSHFSAMFKKKTGIAPINYYNNIRMDKACEYLKFTDVLVKEIAFKLGILDAHYFNRLFKKTIGLTPNAYRKEGKFKE